MTEKYSDNNKVNIRHRNKQNLVIILLKETGNISKQHKWTSTSQKHNFKPFGRQIYFSRNLLELADMDQIR